MGRPLPPPPCRFCGDRRQTEWTEDNRYVFCNTCGKAFPMARPPTPKAPTAKGSL